jgi:hypothetical protein
MWIEGILESNLLKCPNCEELSLDLLTWKCDECWKVQPESNAFVVDYKAIEAIKEIVKNKYLWKIYLVLDKGEGEDFDIYLINKSLYIGESKSIVQLNIWDVDYKFTLNYEIEIERTWDYTEKWNKCVGNVSFSKIQRSEAWVWKNYIIKNTSNNDKIRHFIVLEVLNIQKYNKYLSK